MSERSLSYTRAVRTATGRARPLDPEARRAAIIRAVTPLLLERGREATSRELAEAAGIAEGTVFRAFGDKDSLIDAVLEVHRDLGDVREALAEIPPDASTPEVVERILDLLVTRLTTLVRLSIAVGRHGPPPDGEEHERHRAAFEARARELSDRITAVLEPHADRLDLSPRAVAGYIRMSATAAALPHLHPGMDVTVSEMSHVLCEGVLRR